VDKVDEEIYFLYWSLNSDSGNMVYWLLTVTVPVLFQYRFFHVHLVHPNNNNQ